MIAGQFGNPTSDSARTMVTTTTRDALVVVFAPRRNQRRPAHPSLDATGSRMAASRAAAKAVGCMSVAAIIVAGGKGERAGAEVPKQFADLGDGRTMLDLTFEAFLSCKEVGRSGRCGPVRLYRRVPAAEGSGRGRRERAAGFDGERVRGCRRLRGRRPRSRCGAALREPALITATLRWRASMGRRSPRFSEGHRQADCGRRNHFGSIRETLPRERLSSPRRRRHSGVSSWLMPWPSAEIWT